MLRFDRLKRFLLRCAEEACDYPWELATWPVLKALDKGDLDLELTISSKKRVVAQIMI